MPHYFDAAPTQPTHRQAVQVQVGGRSFACQTDAGVFSRDGLDPGSLLLAQSLPPLQGPTLEIGCGWGAMALAILALQPHLPLTLIDVNQRACQLAADNLAANHLQAAVYWGDAALLLQQPCPLVGVGPQANAADPPRQYAQVVTNPPIRAGNKVVYALYDTAYAALQPGGSLFAVVRKQQGAASHQKQLAGVFGSCRVIEKSGGYWILQATRA